MHSWWLFSADHTCRRAWPSSSVPRRVSPVCGTPRVEVLALPLPAPHCPGCSISCVAVPGCKIALCEYPPFLWHLPSCVLRGRTACGTKPGHPHSAGSHWHIQVILSMLFAKLMAWGFCRTWRPAGATFAVSSPSSSSWDHCRQGNWNC